MLLATAGVGIGVTAGLWQLDRAGEKRDLEARFAAGGAAGALQQLVDERRRGRLPVSHRPAQRTLRPGSPAVARQHQSWAAARVPGADAVGHGRGHGAREPRLGARRRRPADPAGHQRGRRAAGGRRPHRVAPPARHRAGGSRPAAGGSLATAAALSNHRSRPAPSLAFRCGPTSCSSIRRRRMAMCGTGSPGEWDRISTSPTRYNGSAWP